MTVSSTANAVTYMGDGATTSFGFAFYVNAAADLVVTYTDALGNATVISPGNYTLGAPNVPAPGWPNGGSLTYLLNGSPIAAGTRLTLERVVAATQPVSISNQGAMWPSIIEGALDRLTTLVQQFITKVGRSLQAPANDTVAMNLLPIASLRANSVLGFDGAGQPYAAQIVSGLATVSNWVLTNFLPAGSIVLARRALGLDLVVNPMDPTYGAKGDGVHDDAPAFQAAITALIAAGGGRLQVPEPPVAYGWGSTVNVPTASGATSLIEIEGTGRGCVIKPLAVMTSMLSVTGKATAIRGLTFSNASSRATNAILFATSSSDADWSATVERCDFYTFTNAISASGQNYDISDSWFQGNTIDIKFTNDGRNLTIDRNYSLGSGTFVSLNIVSVQAEGVRITNNTALCNAGTGNHVDITAGEEILILGNTFDQAGANTTAVHMNTTGGNAINKVKIAFNWLNGGVGGYSVYASGNTSNVKVIGNTIVGLAGVLAGIGSTSIQRAQIIENDFAIDAGSPDLSITISEFTQHGNTSTQGGSSNALAEIFPFAAFLKRYVATTAPRTIMAATDTPGDTDNYLIANRAGTVTLTLPDPTSANYIGRTIRVLTIQAQTVVSASSNVVPLAGGAAGTAILAATAGKWADLTANGTAWQITASN